VITVSDWVAILKAIAEILKAISWPILVGIVAWLFRKEVARLIGRVSKFKAFGAEMEAASEEIKLALENTKAATSPEAIEQIKKVLADGDFAISATAKPNFVGSLNQLMELAATYPRNAIGASWRLLGAAVLRAAKDQGKSVEPDSEQIATSLKRLEADTQYSQELIRSIKNLQEIARKVYYQSQYAYDPSPKEAEEFVLYSAAARNDLGDKVG
jgi:hypothetical protein